jgi:type IV pilus assembly protein PilB
MMEQRMMDEATGHVTKRIGELLVERGLITPHHLEQALKRQRVTGDFLGATLVGMGVLTEQALLETMSTQFGFPHEALETTRINWEVAKEFPRAVVSEGKAFPIRADKQTVTVAISNPLDAWTLSAMERAAGKRMVLPVLVLERELQKVVKEFQRRTIEALEARLKEGPNGQAK